MKQSIIQQAWYLIKQNLFSLVGFEILYKLLLSLAGIPMLLSLLQWSMDISGFHYLDNTTILPYLLKPATLGTLLLISILMTGLTMIEIQAVITCFHASYHHQNISMLSMLFAGLRKTKAIARRKNILLILFVLLIIPLTNTAAVSGMISSIHIPEFILDFILSHHLLSIMFMLLMAGLFMLSLRWALSLHAYTLQGKNFQQARKSSISLLKGKYGKTIGYLMLWQIVLYLFAALMALLISGAAICIIKLFFHDAAGYAIAMESVYLILLVVSAVLFYCSVPFSFALLSAMYYAYATQKKEVIEPYDLRSSSQKKSWLRRIAAGLVLLIVLSNLAGFLYLQDRDYRVLYELRKQPAITAHRGASSIAPENSIPAFEKAIEAKADWIELDVHQTMDGIIVVTHDADIKRIAGVDKKLYEMTYQELQTYDVGSWFSQEYQGLRVATLEEVIQHCKGKIKLNIELKPTGHEVDFEQHVIDLIRQYDLQKDCVVASLHAQTLQNVKAMDPEISTLYIMSVALGNVTAIPFADNFSIEASFIKEDLLTQIHGAGKQLIAWTVNQEENVRAMVQMGVDNIITDDPANVYQLIYESKASNLVVELVSFFFPDR